MPVPLNATANQTLKVACPTPNKLPTINQRIKVACPLYCFLYGDGNPRKYKKSIKTENKHNNKQYPLDKNLSLPINTNTIENNGRKTIDIKKKKYKTGKNKSTPLRSPKIGKERDR